MISPRGKISDQWFFHVTPKKDNFKEPKEYRENISNRMPNKIYYAISVNCFITGTMTELAEKLGVAKSNIHNSLDKNSLIKKEWIISEELKEFEVPKKQNGDVYFYTNDGVNVSSGYWSHIHNDLGVHKSSVKTYLQYKLYKNSWVISITSEKHCIEKYKDLTK